MSKAITRHAVGAAAMFLAGIAICNAGAAVTLPGTIEAESFNAGGEGVGYHDNTPGNQGNAKYRTTESVDVFRSNDPAGGVYVVKNFDSGEWLAYTISVPAAGNYDFELRAATSATFPNRAFHLEVDGANATGTVVLPDTGGWSNYQWIGKRRLALTAGTHVLKVVAERPYFALNSIRATAAPLASPYFGTPTLVPGTVDAENFDNGGEGVGYHDNTAGNQGDAGFRPNEGVDIFYSNDGGSGSAYIVKNFEAGEWLGYTISVPAGGNFDFELRAASSVDFPNSAFHLEIDGANATGTVVLPDTGGWGNYQWLGKSRLALTAGTHVVKIVCDRAYFGLNSIRVTAAAAQSPYLGAPAIVPGSFEAENFDNGGEGVGYHDTTAGNQGDAAFRTTEGVDLFSSNDSAGGTYVVKAFETGEWLAYTISVPTAGNFDVEVRAATSVDSPNRALHVEVDGANATGTVALPDTGGLSNYQWIGKSRLALTAGTHVLKFVAERSYFALNSVRLTVPVAPPPPPPPDPSAVLFSCGFALSSTDCSLEEQAKVPGRATLTSIAREGATGIRLHTEPGDNNVASSGEMERDDLWLSQAASDGYEGHEAWWAHSIFFPDDFTTPTWESYVVFDFHNSGSGPWQANFMVNFQRQADTTQPGLLSMVGYGGANNTDGRYDVALGQVQKNVWYDFVYHVRWSSASDGIFDAWVNGKRVLSHRGPTLYAGQGVYLKLANYHNPVCDPYPACIGTHHASSVIHDRVIRGTTPLAVAAGPLEGVLALVNGVLTPIVP